MEYVRGLFFCFFSKYKSKKIKEYKCFLRYSPIFYVLIRILYIYSINTGRKKDFLPSFGDRRSGIRRVICFIWTLGESFGCSVLRFRFRFKGPKQSFLGPPATVYNGGRWRGQWFGDEARQCSGQSSQSLFRDSFFLRIHRNVFF